MFSCDGYLMEERMVLTTGTLKADLLLQAVQGVELEHVLVASVVPQCEAEIRQAFGDKAVFVGSKSVLNFELDYPGAVTLGADRIANVAGMVQLGHVPGVAVDMGTATTFDVVLPGVRGPRFVGGTIAPGLPALTQYLACGTAQLPKVELSATPRAIGRNTVESIQGGCLLGYCGLVRGILSSVQQELGYKPYMVATGGDADFLSTYLPEIDVVDPLLTFRGLNALASLLF